MALIVTDLSAVRNIAEIFKGVVSENWSKLSDGGLMVWLIFGFSAYCFNSFKLRPQLQITKKSKC